ncbi:hypothetical protein CFN78_10425 [Amycolatopsis antarctica]|uniref:PPE domain-containing protein n=1 Tax=Amycolatopsis antarctica TaxID=1854586 RepID=A0A263D4Y9_9PSEU|nr:PPE domain-containing protein [Amycolatopsis antarctica]OZM73269.1 hypothetical protein CFN78_10425 [Amycolatopsis antarctica]
MTAAGQRRILAMPWPPREPEPGPQDLDGDVDWMTYSHAELYAMAHEGVNLAEATSVAASWAELAEELDELGARLGKALAASADGWEGEAADAARAGVERLVSWTSATAASGKDVSTCVIRQADIAETARRTMPEPPEASPVRRCVALNLVADPGPERLAAQQLHRRAAEVMQRMQQASNEVYADVPAFTSPMPRTELRRTPEKPVAPEPEREVTADPRREPPAEATVPGHREATTPSAGEVSPSATPAGPLPGGPSAHGGVGITATGGGASGAQAPAAPLAAGTLAGSRALPRTNRTAGQGPASATAPQARGGGMGTGMGMAGMPMGMAGAGMRQDDAVERTTPGYLEEDSGFWSSDVLVSPPVLGEEPTARPGRY